MGPDVPCRYTTVVLAGSQLVAFTDGGFTNVEALKIVAEVITASTDLWNVVIGANPLVQQRSLKK